MRAAFIALGIGLVVLPLGNEVKWRLPVLYGCGIIVGILFSIAWLRQARPP